MKSTQNGRGLLVELYRLILTGIEQQGFDGLSEEDAAEGVTVLRFKFKNQTLTEQTTRASNWYIHLCRLAALKYCLAKQGVELGQRQPHSKSKRKQKSKDKDKTKRPTSSQSRGKPSILSSRGQPGSRASIVAQWCKGKGLRGDRVLEALKEVVKVIGLSNVQKDFGVNYMLAAGIQFTIDEINLKPFIFRPRGERVGLQDFQIVRCLGIGGFSRVFLVRALFNGRMYAMKLMLKQFIQDYEKETIVKNEREIIQDLDNPFLVKLYFAFETQSYVAFVMDYCAGGELFYHLRKIRRMSEAHARFYFVEILAGLQYLHHRKILYRDLKPENLLISIDGHIKIADFGLSKPNVGRDQLAYTFCGSAEYMPPEMILNQGHTFTVDYYTLGALLYEMVCGLPPFYSKDPEEIKDAIVKKQLEFPEDLELSSQIKQILKGLLHKKPKNRLGSYSGVKEILYHPWVGKVKMADVLLKRLAPPHIPSPQQFNFDKSQMGSDQQQFTQSLLNQQKKNPSFKPIFKKFYFDSVDDNYNKYLQLYNELVGPVPAKQGKSDKHSTLNFNTSLSFGKFNNPVVDKSLARQLSEPRLNRPQSPAAAQSRQKPAAKSKERVPSPPPKKVLKKVTKNNPFSNLAKLVSKRSK